MKTQKLTLIIATVIASLALGFAGCSKGTRSNSGTSSYSTSTDTTGATTSSISTMAPASTSATTSTDMNSPAATSGTASTSTASTR